MSGIRFRGIQEGEILQAGDQFLDDDYETWVSIPTGEGKCIGDTWLVGQIFAPCFHKPFRRQIANKIEEVGKIPTENSI